VPITDCLISTHSCKYELKQWFLIITNTPNPYVVFQDFVEPNFCPI